MNILFSIIYFIIVLGILVFVHEGGHFLMAKISGMRVDAFSLGMGFRLFGWNKVNGFTFGKLPESIELNGKTDYRIAAFPIGGYCKIAGMVDESFDTNYEGQEPQEWEFRAKNPFKQAITICGGVLFNLILAILFFAFVILGNGESTYKTTIIGAVEDNTIGSIIGLKGGDKILSINSQKPNNWTELVQFIAIDNLGEDLHINIIRNGKDTSLFIDGKSQTENISSQIPLGIEPAGLQTVVVEVVANGIAKEKGIQQNDTIVSVNSIQVYSSQDFINKMQKNKNTTVIIGIKNNNGISEKSFKLDETGTIGVQITSAFTGTIQTINYNFLQSIGKGFTQTFETFGTIGKSIWQIIVGNLEFKKAIGGPVMIAKQAAQFAERGFYSFLSFTAMLSVSLAFINILPLPALDGGHLVMIIIEGFRRREIPIKTKLMIQQVGMFLLLALMAYVIFNDIHNLI